jgi:SPP1 family predicted phage head-tail adaptor
MPTLFVDPGALRTELSLQAQDNGADGMGGLIEGWTEIATVFGQIEPRAQASGFGAGQTLETLTHRITIRHRPGVESGMRLVRQARSFEILTVHDPDETGRYLVCRVREDGA